MGEAAASTDDQSLLGQQESPHPLPPSRRPIQDRSRSSVDRRQAGTKLAGDQVEVTGEVDDLAIGREGSDLTLWQRIPVRREAGQRIHLRQEPAVETAKGHEVA